MTSTFTRFCVMLLCSISFLHAGPRAHAPGLLISGDAISLEQADFDSGTYRITQPGYYYLSEDITFNPVANLEAQRADKPLCDWSAIISIEADCVTLDLNTFCMKSSEDYLITRSLAKNFSGVQLGNTPFAPEFAPLFLVGFVGEATLKVPRNTVIKNGTIGRCQASCINAATAGEGRIEGLHCYDLSLRDFEGAGVHGSRLSCARFENMCIDSFRGNIVGGAKCSQLAWALKLLNVLKDEADPADVDAHIAAVQGVLDTVCTDTVFYPEGLPVSSGLVATGASASVCIDSVRVCDMLYDIPEYILMVPQSSLPSYNGHALSASNILRAGLLGPLDWFDAYPAGSFAPNELFKAATYIADTWPTVFALPEQQISPPLPTGFATNILGGANELTFLGQVSPLFGHSAWGDKLLGLHGITTDADCLKIKDCTICSLENKGGLGLIETQLPSHQLSELITLPAERYTGNDVRGIDCNDRPSVKTIGVQGGKIKNCCVSHLYSWFGGVVGYALHADSSSNAVRHCAATDLQGGYPSKWIASCNPAIVNPASSVSGFDILSSHANWVTDCSASLIRAPRDASGFALYGGNANAVKNCKAYDIAVTMTSELDEGDAKRAFGFGSFNCSCTEFFCCKAGNIRIMGEPNDTIAMQPSVAAGFMLFGKDVLSDERTHVHNCASTCVQSGAGSAVGVYLKNTKYAKVIENEVTDAFATTNVGKGYGVWDTSSATDSIILKNFACNNETYNYKVTFNGGTQPGQALPLSTGTSGNVYNLANVNPFNNILIEKYGKTPKEFKESTVKRRTRVFETIENGVCQ